MTIPNFISKFIKVISFCLIFISFISPFQVFAQTAGGSSTAGANGPKFYQDRLTCTNSYYNIGDYGSAAKCYESTGQAACPSNSFACDWSKTNKTLALTNYKNNVCNPKYNSGDYAGAGSCYDTGIALSCNSSYNDSNLCSIFTSNRNLVNRTSNTQTCLYNCSGSTSSPYNNTNYINQINQLNNFKSNCNQNYYNGNYQSFINCSQQGANTACAISGSEASELCNIFNSNATLGQRALQNCGYYNNYPNCNNTSNDTVTTIAAIATGVVVIGCLLGACNSSNPSYNSGGSSSAGPSGGAGSGQY